MTKPSTLTRRALGVAAGFAVAGLAGAAEAAPGFAETLDAHLQAVAAGDLAALEATLTRGEELHLILPNGTHTTTRAEYLDFHREFFADASWRMSFEPVSSMIAAGMAVATFRTRYAEVSEGEESWSESWLTLTFREEDGAWGLVWDQNTRIRTGP